MKFACWYDGLIRGLSDGNELYIWQIKEFGKKETFFSEEDIYLVTGTVNE